MQDFDFKAVLKQYDAWLVSGNSVFDCLESSVECGVDEKQASK